jgi:S-DNA-T family DNA segregation ATPase FtsK/SpoIIIE
MKNNQGSNSFRHIYGGVLLAILSILFFLAIISGKRVVANDYQILKNAGLSFFDFVTLNFPVVNNLIGPFGAFFGYWFLFLTGELFSFFVLFSVFTLGLINIFFPDKSEYKIKSVSVIFVGFFFNISLLATGHSLVSANGVIVDLIYKMLFRIFNSTGTAIISIALLLGFIVAIIGTPIIIDLLRSIGRMIKKLFTPSTLPKERVKPRKLLSGPKENKKKDKNNVREELLAEQENKMIPTITDHVEHGGNNGDLSEEEDDFYHYGEEIPAESNKIQQEKRKTSQSKKKIIIPFDDVPTGEYKKPEVERFLKSSAKVLVRDREEMELTITNTSRILIEKLAQFGVEAEVVNVNIGPIITQYELKPAPNVKVSRFLALADDLALAIKSKSIRVQAPIPGRGLIGIEVPNKEREIIYLKDILLSDQMAKNQSKLAIALGKDIVGTPVVADLAGMPHLLIAGSTGSGKSVCINSLICNLLFRATPEEMRLVLIDPKRIELSGYEGIPHLIQDVVSDAEEALIVLNWAVKEMERRYELLQHYNVRDLNSYNRKIRELIGSSKEPYEEETLPYIIIIIDEFADLMMRSGRDIEIPITRLAQLARAIGIHLVLATQRPSIKIITGLIKANFPSRIAFQVAQKIDSRVILDMNGAENLLGKGDMLFIPPTKGQAERIHGAFVSDGEIEELIEYLRSQPKPEQKIEIVSESEEDVEMVEFDDELFIEAAKLIVSADTASVSMLQRHFKIGYARAGRLIDMLERAKIIGKYAGSKSRDVIATQETLNAYGID